MIGHLLGAKWRQLRNTPRSSGESRGKVALFLLFGALIGVGVYLGSSWFLSRCLEVEPIGELIVEKTLDLLLLVITSMLLFSSVIISFSTFFLSDDLQLLMSRPIRAESFYTARLLETVGLAAWMPLFFAAPVFINAGVLFGAGWDYYALLPLVLAPLGFMSASLASLVTLALTNVLPAHRTRDVMVFLGVLVFVVLFVLFRAINPEELLGDKQFGNTMEMFAALGTPTTSWWPSAWAMEALRPTLRGEGLGEAWRPLAGLYTTAGGLYFLGAWGFRRWHFAGFSKALEGRHAGGGLERAGGWLAGRRASGPEAAKRAIARLAARAGRLSPTREMMAKDARIFIRDTAQWSQLVLLVALVVVYLLNFRYFRSLGEGGIIGPFGLFVMNIGLCGFIVASVGVRFLYPAISLEGRAFWLIRTSPQTMHHFVLSKWVTGAVPLVVISLVLTLASNWMIGASGWLALVSTVVILALDLGLAGLGVGLGALYPRFDSDDASKIATSFGGMLYMLLGLLLVLVVTASIIPPAWALVQWDHGVGEVWMWKRKSWLVVLGASASILVPLVSGWLALKLGARRLSRLG